MSQLGVLEVLFRFLLIVWIDVRLRRETGPPARSTITLGSVRSVEVFWTVWSSFYLMPRSFPQSRLGTQWQNTPLKSSPKTSSASMLGPPVASSQCVIYNI